MKMIKIFGLLLFIGLFFTACSDDDPAPNSDPDTQADPDPDSELESAWLTGFRIETPQGRLWYMNVSEEVPENYDISESIELGLNQTVYSFGENPFVFDGNAKTITKWDVDKTDLSAEPSGILSLVSSGYNRTFAVPAFVSETRAFVSNLQEGLMIEWNPTDMSITQVYQVEPLVSKHDNAQAFDAFNYVWNNKIFIPIAQIAPSICCEINADNMETVVAVFDLGTNTLEYVTDERMMATVIRVPRDENGRLYIAPEQENSYIQKYFNYDINEAPSPHTILRMNEDGSFDEDFAFDLDDVLDIEVFNELAFVFDNKAVINYIDSSDGQLPPAYDDRREIFSGTSARTVAVDLVTGEVTPFDVLDKYDFVIYYNTIDGKDYYINFSYDTEGTETSYIVRQDGFESYTELSSYENAAAQWVDKLWGDQ